jgi:uncharacterized membrane protein YfcA
LVPVSAGAVANIATLAVTGLIGAGTIGPEVAVVAAVGTLVGTAIAKYFAEKKPTPLNEEDSQ